MLQRYSGLKAQHSMKQGVPPVGISIFPSVVVRVCCTFVNRNGGNCHDSPDNVINAATAPAKWVKHTVSQLGMSWWVVKPEFLLLFSTHGLEEGSCEWVLVGWVWVVCFFFPVFWQLKKSLGWAGPLLRYWKPNTELEGQIVSNTLSVSQSSIVISYFLLLH